MHVCHQYRTFFPYAFIHIYGKINNAEDAITHRARGEFPYDRVRRPQHGENMRNT